ncbi:hypothetical protein BJF78_11910 [Pseudonocardia sp. CNS-139]|nr:hypothetical protein BJF78_11910 [Pseudonocardia sp. CNS-139]
MRVNERRAPWRHPALAPVYAAAIAFGAVALAGTVVAPQEQVAVTVPATLPDLVVEVRDGTTVLARSEPGVSEWSRTVPAGEHDVCVTSASPVRIAGTDPASACVPVPADGTAALPVERPAVVVRDGDAVPATATVTVRDSAGGREIHTLGATGRLTPAAWSPSSEVCVELPAGWRFAGSDARECRAVTNPAADLLFDVEGP